MVDNKLNVSQQCALAAVRAVIRSRKVFLPLCPVLGTKIQSTVSSVRKILALWQIQQRSTKLVSGLELRMHPERLGLLALLCLEKRRLEESTLVSPNGRAQRRQRSTAKQTIAVPRQRRGSGPEIVSDTGINKVPCCTPCRSASVGPHLLFFPPPSTCH